MEYKRKWSREDLEKSISVSKSIRQTISKLGLVEAGGNYTQIKKYIKLYKLDTSHFSGQTWNKGITGYSILSKPLIEILTKNSSYQSFKLKQRLFKEKLKEQKCEECGWSKKSEDGRLPLELDHVNGQKTDNRIENLRVLCPNCHSLKPTHRGRNKKRY